MKNIIKIMEILIFVTSTLHVSSARAANLFSDDFDSYIDHRFPSGWNLLFDGAGVDLQIVEKRHAVSLPNSLKLVGAQCWSADAYQPVAFPSATPPAHLHVQVSAEVLVGKFGAGGCDNTTGHFGLWNPSIGSWGEPYAGVLFGSDGYVYSHVGTTETRLVSYDVNKWYNISIDVDMTSLTCEISIDNVLVASGVPVSNAFAPLGVDLDAGHGSNNPTMFYDNVVVRTPVVSE